MNGFITALQKGYGAMFHVNASSPYTDFMHWMVAADIRETELGSGIGYDIYILSSTHICNGYGWQPIENISSYIYSWGYFIEN